MPYIKSKSWFYQKFICVHALTGQIRVEKSFSNRGGNMHKKRHYRQCPKCGKKFYID